jgi:succinoglycan biosynthesis protein ExoA
MLISVIIPCFNEEKFIESCIASLLKQKNIPGNFEILVVDGISTDSTRSILNSITVKNTNVKVIDNVKKITPVAFNLGIRNSSGEYICIMGAHSEYDENYLANCLKLFSEHPEVSCVGGPIISKGKNNFAKATAIAMSSPVGVGNAKHRFPDYEGYAEMACFPMFKRVVFDEVGLYDETLVRNQDDEFCFRLRLNGGKIYISPAIVSEYFVRDTPAGLFKQYYDYGKWRIVVLRKHKIPIAFRQFVPALFFTIILLFAVVSLFIENITIGLFIPAVYIISLIIASLKVLPANGTKVAVNFIFSVIILHLSYASGFISGLFNTPLKSTENSTLQ